MAITMPQLGSDLGIDTSWLAVASGAYPLLVAMLVLPAGRAGDRFGRRPVFLVGASLFLLGALISTLAANPWALTSGRLLQGIGGAALAPQALAMIPCLFTPLAQNGAFARLAMTASFASVCGPLIAGVLLVATPSWLGWRTIFLAEAGFALICVLVVPRRLDLDGKASGTGASPAEIASFAGIIFCLVGPLYIGPAYNWPWQVFLLLGMALPCAVVFKYSVTQTGRVALVPRKLILSSSFRLSLVFLLLVVSAPPGFLMVLSLVLQSELELSALQTGLVTATFQVGIVVGTWIAGRLPLQPTGGVVLGTVPLCISFMLIRSILPHVAVSSLWSLRTAMLVGGIAMGVTIASVVRWGMSVVPDDLAGAGAGVIHTTQQVSTAISIALSLAIFDYLLATHPRLEAASATLLLHITSTSAAVILAAALLHRNLLVR